MAQHFDDKNIDVRMEESNNVQKWRADYSNGNFEIVTELEYLDFRRSTVTHEQILLLEGTKKYYRYHRGSLQWDDFPYLSKAEFGDALKLGKQSEELRNENEKKKKLRVIEIDRLTFHTVMEVPVPTNNEVLLSLVVVGKTGNGKSATANTLLGDKESFKEGEGIDAVTDEIEIKTSKWKDVNIQIIDTPGLFDTRLSIESVLKAIAHVVVESSNGVHAFVFVVSAHNRFTEEELKSLHELKLHFGKEFVKHSMLVFSHGNRIIEDCTSVKFVCNRIKSYGDETKKFMEDFGDNITAVDNKSDVLAIQKRNRDTLISMALRLSENCQSAYSNALFTVAQREKKKIKLSELGELIYGLLKTKIREDSSYIQMIDQQMVPDEFVNLVEEQLAVSGFTFTRDEIERCTVDVMEREMAIFNEVYREVEGNWKHFCRQVCVLL